MRRSSVRAVLGAHGGQLMYDGAGVRVGIADGDRRFRSALALELRRAGCAVTSCPDAATLARALHRHARGVPGAALTLLAVDLALPQAEGVAELRALGVFEAGPPVVVSTYDATSAVERAAFSAGATLLVRKARVGLAGAVQAIRHVVHQQRRWRGDWISTGLLARSPRPRRDDATPD